MAPLFVRRISKHCKTVTFFDAKSDGEIEDVLGWEIINPVDDIVTIRLNVLNRGILEAVLLFGDEGRICPLCGQHQDE